MVVNPLNEDSTVCLVEEDRVRDICGAVGEEYCQGCSIVRQQVWVGSGDSDGQL